MGNHPPLPLNGMRLSIVEFVSVSVTSQMTVNAYHIQQGLERWSSETPFGKRDKAPVTNQDTTKSWVG